MERTEALRILGVLLAIGCAALTGNAALLSALPQEIAALAARGAHTDAERALLNAAATRYDVPGYAPRGKCDVAGTYAAMRHLGSYTSSQRGFVRTLTARPGMDAASDSALAGISDSDFRMSFVFMVVDDFALMVD